MDCLSALRAVLAARRLASGGCREHVKLRREPTTPTSDDNPVQVPRCAEFPESVEHLAASGAGAVCRHSCGGDTPARRLREDLDEQASCQVRNRPVAGRRVVDHDELGRRVVAVDKHSSVACAVGALHRRLPPGDGGRLRACGRAQGNPEPMHVQRSGTDSSNRPRRRASASSRETWAAE